MTGSPGKIPVFLMAHPRLVVCTIDLVSIAVKHPCLLHTLVLNSHTSSSSKKNVLGTIPTVLIDASIILLPKTILTVLKNSFSSIHILASETSSTHQKS